MLETHVRVHELTKTVENMLETAAAVTAGRMHLESPETVWALLVSDDQTALQYFRYELARQVAVLVLRSDTNVQGVYIDDDLPEAEEMVPYVEFGEPLRLAFAVTRSTAALKVMVKSLNTLLCEVLHARTNRVLSRMIEPVFDDPERVARYRPAWRGHRPPPTLLADRSVSGPARQQSISD